MDSHSIPVITTQDALDRVCENCLDDAYICIDTEFHRETTFWPKLCLVQLANATEAVIIDPLAGDLDFSALGEILLSPDIVKVFHAARQDIEIFNKMLGETPKNIFDTQVAALALGVGDSISYEALVQHYLRKPVDKSSQFTDWTRRPLSSKQLIYALGDVTHLYKIYPKMRDALTNLGRTKWVAEDLAALSAPETYDTNPKNAWQKLKLRRPKRDYVAVLASVAEWREEMAHKEDKPRRRIIKDDAIYEISDQKPTTKAGFEGLRAVPRGFMNSRYAEGLEAAVARAIADPDAYAPPLPTRGQQPQIPAGAPEMLRVLLKSIAEEAEIIPRLIANSEDLERIARGETGADVRSLTGWRHEVFGKHALDLMSGKIALTFENHRVKISKTDPTP